MLENILQLAGSLGLFLFGMRVMSDGIQKAAGDRLQSILRFMTGNRFVAIITGFLITVLVQSSSASTVMVVGFVNAQLLSLAQAIGVILGANIGTTITGWIVAVFGFSVNISAASFPALALGTFLLFNTRLNKQPWGEALIGFGILFLGLMFLKDGVPDIRQHPEVLEIIASFTGHGIFSLLLFVIIGALITVVMQSSSAAMAVTLTMAYSGWIDYPTAAAIVLGENIGTTFTAFLASLGTDVNARRASRAHTLFNIFGVLWMLILFRPFLMLVDAIVPGQMLGGSDPTLLPAHLAAFHTLFNITNSLVFVGWIPWFAKLVQKLVPDKDGDTAEEYSLAYLVSYVSQNPELYLLQMKDEVARMAGVVLGMYRTVVMLLSRPTTPLGDEVRDLKRQEDVTDLMEEEISSVLAAAATDSLNASGVAQINTMMRVINELERMADSCYNLTLNLERRYVKKYVFDEAAQQDLIGYSQQVLRFVEYIHDHLLRRLDGDQMAHAFALEKLIDEGRDTLKRAARKRIKRKANSIKAELVYIDIVGQIELIGDFALAIARYQRELPQGSNHALEIAAQERDKAKGR
ncbi:MAG: Na/Pi cotransporter family protein [Spirochaetaceae bacterium]|nr:MAG: Na/Pi cotransporter family protein [Spirochaetaceae bacterium]